LILYFARASACCARFTKPGSFVAVLAILLLVACAPKEDVTGAITRGLDGEPLAAGAVVATPVDAVDRCPALEATVTDGEFTLTKPCHRPYALAMADGTWITPTTWDGGELALTAWPLTAGARGVWVVHPDGVVPVEPIARVVRDALADGTPIRFPEVLPADPPKVAAGDWLALVGGTIEALPESGEATLAGGAVAPWRYVGVAITAGTASPVAAVPTSTRSPGDDAVFVPGGALPPGLYAVEAGDRAVIVAFE
jgi:hypothetical protein